MLTVVLGYMMPNDDVGLYVVDYHLILLTDIRRRMIDLVSPSKIEGN